MLEDYILEAHENYHKIRLLTNTLINRSFYNISIYVLFMHSMIMPYSVLFQRKVNSIANFYSLD